MTGPGEHGSAAKVEILPVTGLGEFRPGDDLAGALAQAAPWLADGDIVVVTSKVVSKCEGRIVPAPHDPEARDALRRQLVEAEAVRVLARKAAPGSPRIGSDWCRPPPGVDGSNVGACELALLPVDPDGSAATLRARLAEQLGVDVAVLITDTMGRAWRHGQIDVAIGASGLTVLNGYAGAVDRHGNELVVTEVAVADELAAAADLVKGKLTDVPVAVVRGVVSPDDGSTAAALVRSGPEDLFWLGTAEAIEAGAASPAAAPLGARVLRRAGAGGDDHRRHRRGADRPGTPPHPADAVRLAAEPGRAHPAARRHGRQVARRPDRRRQIPEAVEARVARGRILYEAPEVVIPVMVPDGAHHYPDATRTAAEHTMFTVAVGAAVQALLVALAVRGVGSCWIGSTIFTPDLVRAELDLPTDWEPLGAIAIGYSVEPPEPRPPAAIDGLLVRR